MRWILVAGLLGLAGCAHSPCDLNDDGKPGTTADFKVFQWSLGSEKGDYNYVKDADFDGNGTVTVADYSLYLEQCGEKK